MSKYEYYIKINTIIGFDTNIWGDIKPEYPN